MTNNWACLILSSAFYESDYLISSTFLTTISSIAAIFITLMFCVKRRSPASSLSKVSKSQLSAPSPSTPGTPKENDGKNPQTNKAANGKEKPSNDNGKKVNPGQSLRAEGEKLGESGGEAKGNKPGEQKIDVKDGSNPAAGGGIGPGGYAVTTAKDSKRHQEKNRDLLDETQKSHQSTKKKKRASGEKPKERKSKSDKMKDGGPIFAPEMDVGSDEETLQNVKSLEKENEHSLQHDGK